MKNYEILLVDDDPNILEVTACALGHRGYQVTTASSGKAAIEALRMKGFDLVITDLNMPETDGIAVVKKAKELNRDGAVMLFTGSGDAILIAEALRAGADDCVLKPCRIRELWKRVDNCVGRSEDRPIGAQKEWHAWGKADISMR